MLESADNRAKAGKYIVHAVGPVNNVAADCNNFFLNSLELREILAGQELELREVIAVQNKISEQYVAANVAQRENAQEIMNEYRYSNQWF